MSSLPLESSFTADQKAFAIEWIQEMPGESALTSHSLAFEVGPGTLVHSARRSVYLLRAPLDPSRPVVVLRVAVEVLFSIILLGLSIAICGRLRRKKAVHVEVCLLGLGGVHTAAFAAHYHQMLQLDPGAALSIDDVANLAARAARAGPCLPAFLGVAGTVVVCNVLSPIAPHARVALALFTIPYAALLLAGAAVTRSPDELLPPAPLRGLIAVAHVVAVLGISATLFGAMYASGQELPAFAADCANCGASRSLREKLDDAEVLDGAALRSCLREASDKAIDEACANAALSAQTLDPDKGDLWTEAHDEAARQVLNMLRFEVAGLVDRVDDTPLFSNY